MTKIGREREEQSRASWRRKESFTSAIFYTWRAEEQEEAWSNKLWCPRTVENLHYDLHELLYAYIG